MENETVDKTGPPTNKAPNWFYVQLQKFKNDFYLDNILHTKSGCQMKSVCQMHCSWSRFTSQSPQKRTGLSFLHKLNQPEKIQEHFTV